MIMRLIAFAYTYHYLNWFSKTSIIKWHEIPKSRTATIAVVWLASIALYAYNYDSGMAILYFLSILHVMLSFHSITGPSPGLAENSTLLLNESGRVNAGSQ